MADRLALALAQINPALGDLAGNIALIRSVRQKAAGMGADLAVFPELALSGYPLEDLALRRDFLDHCRQALTSLAGDTADGGPGLLIGLPLEIEKQGYNCAALLDGGRVTGIGCKRQLSNDDMFDEKRLFAAGPPPEPLIFRGIRLGIMIGQDMWTPGVSGCLQQAGAELLVAIDGSPFEAGKSEKRRLAAAERVAQSQRPLVYVNQCGGQDDLAFDGASFALNANGRLVCQLPGWQTDTVLTIWQRDAGGTLACPPGPVTHSLQGHAAIYNAMILALRDYVQKNRFPGVVLGLSGGVDSALAAAIAVDALGRDKVWAVMMPSCHTSQDSLEDAALVAQYLGIRLDVIAIGPAMRAFDAMLAPILSRDERDIMQEPDIMQENVQSRSRGLTLMAISNKFGPMALATGNKSEFSVGYATLYGDMCGGYAILKDVYKTTVFALSNWRNRHKPAGSLGPNGPVMPERVIAKPPSAELKPNQTDQDTLPPYDVLDGILAGLIEEQASQADLIARGYDQATVQQVWDMLDRAEYKRRQAPPGVKITRRSFGRERRYPIVNRYRGSV